MVKNPVDDLADEILEHPDFDREAALYPDAPEGLDAEILPPEVMSKAGKLSSKYRIMRQIKEIFEKDCLEASEYLDIKDHHVAKLKSGRKNVIDLFLVLYASIGTISGACGYLPVTASTITNYKKDHPRFAAACLDAQNMFQASLIEEATRRARDGVEEDIFFKDKKIGVKVNYSDRLMEKLLDGFGGDRFKRTQDAGGPGGVQINILLSDGSVLGEKNDDDNKPTIQLQTTGVPTSGVEVHGAEVAGSEEAQVPD